MVSWIRLFLVIVGLAFVPVLLTGLVSESLVSVAHAEEGQKWTCGMHPWVISDDKDSLCPICAMELTPVVSGASGAIIEIDPTVEQSMGVRVAPVKRGRVSKTLRLPGRVVADESREYSITSRVSGYLEKMYASRTGQVVNKGDKLYDLYSPAIESELIDLAASTSVAKTLGVIPVLKDDGSKIVAAAKHRLGRYEVSDSVIQKVADTGKAPDVVPFYSKYSGFVTMKMAREGDQIAAGQQVLMIADLSTIWVLVDVYESDLSADFDGAELTLSLPGRPDQLSATVDHVYPYLDAKTRTNKLRVVLENHSLALKPEMFVDVSMDLASSNSALYVPEEAVVYTGEDRSVFVKIGDGKFEPRSVETGLRGNGLIELTGGVKEGEDVVVSAQFMFDSETQLRQALKKMMEPESADEDLEDLF